jgi:hypothetical protein
MPDPAFVQAAPPVGASNVVVKGEHAPGQI